MSPGIPTLFSTVDEVFSGVCDGTTVASEVEVDLSDGVETDRLRTWEEDCGGERLLSWGCRRLCEFWASDAIWASRGSPTNCLKPFGAWMTDGGASSVESERSLFAIVTSILPRLEVGFDTLATANRSPYSLDRYTDDLES